MSDTNPDEHLDDADDGDGPAGLRKHAKTLERELKEARQQLEQADAARRELALIKAGVDVDTPTGKLFAKAYDGELSIDAVKAAAVEYGVVAPPPATTATADEQQSWERQGKAQAEGSPATGTDWDELIRKAQNPAEVRDIMARKMQEQR